MGRNARNAAKLLLPQLEVLAVLDVQRPLGLGLDGELHAPGSVAGALLLLDAPGELLDHLHLLVLCLHLRVVLGLALRLFPPGHLVALCGRLALGPLGLGLVLVPAEALPLALPHALLARAALVVGGGGALHALGLEPGLVQPLLLVGDGLLRLLDQQRLPLVEVGVVRLARGGLAHGGDLLAVLGERHGRALERVRLDLGLLLLEEGELRLLRDGLHGPGVVRGGDARLHHVLLGLLAAVRNGAQAVVLAARDLALLARALAAHLRHALARRDGGDGGALGQDLVDLQRLVARLHFLLHVGVAGRVDGEELLGRLLGNDAAAGISAYEQHGIVKIAIGQRIPCDHLVPHLVEASGNLGDVDILPPGLLALAALLLVLCGRCL